MRSLVAKMHASSVAKEARKSHARSRVSGRDVLPDVDGRSIIARRYRDISSAIFIDLGGVEHCSESKQQLVRRFAACSLIAEQMEAALARGEKFDIAEHAQLSSTLVRLSMRIGVDRQARDITPTLREILQEEAQHDG